jgi:hypothetical protein
MEMILSFRNEKAPPSLAEVRDQMENVSPRQFNHPFVALVPYDAEPNFSRSGGGAIIFNKT